MASKSLRDIRIEVLRFLFAFIVVMVHTNGLRPETSNYPFVGGYLAVEFFLILTGYYTACSLKTTNSNIQQGKIGEYAICYTFEKFKPLFP